MPISVADFLTDAGLSIQGLQIGEPMTANESALFLRTFQQLIDSLGLDRSNITTIQQRNYSLVPSQQSYTLGTDPDAARISVTSAFNGIQTVINVATPHGLTPGQSNAVVIAGGAGNWLPLNGGFIATPINANMLSIPLDSTDFGALTGSPITLQVAGQWDYVRPTRISDIKLILTGQIMNTIREKDSDQWAEINYLLPQGPPRYFYNDKDAPLSRIYFHLTPDQVYGVRIFSAQPIPQVVNLTDTIVFAQGYERYLNAALAIELAVPLGLDPSASLVNKFTKAEALVKTSNRRTPAIKTDPSLNYLNNTVVGRAAYLTRWVG